MAIVNGVASNQKFSSAPEIDIDERRTITFFARMIKMNESDFYDTSVPSKTNGMKQQQPSNMPAFYVTDLSPNSYTPNTKPDDALVIRKLVPLPPTVVQRKDSTFFTPNYTPSAPAPRMEDKQEDFAAKVAGDQLVAVSIKCRDGKTIATMIKRRYLGGRQDGCTITEEESSMISSGMTLPPAISTIPQKVKRESVLDMPIKKLSEVISGLKNSNVEMMRQMKTINRDGFSSLCSDIDALRVCLDLIKEMEDVE